MLNNRQVRIKESSLGHPSASLHFVQVGRFLQEYQHARMLRGINLSVGMVQSLLPQKDIDEESFNPVFDVPYIQSQHYDSNQTFVSEQGPESQENFTDEEEEGQQPEGKRKFVEEEFKAEDFWFVGGKNSKQSRGTFPFSSTVHSESQEQPQSFPKEQNIQLYQLQQTAHFPQQSDPLCLDRRLSYGSLKENQSQQINVQVNTCGNISRKALFLNKIQQEKSRKEIVEVINRERHHIKKFLK